MGGGTVVFINHLLGVFRALVFYILLVVLIGILRGRGLDLFVGYSGFSCRVLHGVLRGLLMGLG